MKVLRRELKIVRGTFAEISAVPTEDMTIYLCWDTKQFAVGNSLGVKVFYNSDNLSRQEVLDLITEAIGQQLLDINALITQTNVNYINFSSRLDTMETEITGFSDLASQIVTEKTNEILAMLENNELGDTYYNKTEINERFSGVYTKLDMDTKIPDVSIYATEEDLLALDAMIKPFLAVNLIVQDETNEEITHSELAILSLIPTLVSGLYKVLSSEYGPSLVIVDSITQHTTRYMSTGEIYHFDYSNSNWILEFDKNTAVFSVNEILPITNNVSIIGDDIPNGNNHKWNTLLPQSGELNGMAYVDAINPLGRAALSIAGSKSVAIGLDVSASGESSISIGDSAIASKTDSIQLGTGTNSTEGTFQVGQYRLLDSDGYIPQERISERFFEIQIIIPIDSWNDSKLSTITIPGMTSEALVWVSPAETSYELYIKNRIRSVEQGIDYLVFKCKDLPGEPATVNVVWRI